MKLLSKSSANDKIKKDNDELIDTNIRLREAWKQITLQLNTLKDNYDPEKLLKLKDFEAFCKDLLVKKTKLLQELTQIEQEITRKKDIYYGLIEKQDRLDERIYQIQEAQKKLDLRQIFVEDLEQKWRQKNS